MMAVSSATLVGDKTIVAKLKFCEMVSTLSKGQLQILEALSYEAGNIWSRSGIIGSRNYVIWASISLEVNSF